MENLNRLQSDVNNSITEDNDDVSTKGLSQSLSMQLSSDPGLVASNNLEKMEERSCRHKEILSNRQTDLENFQKIFDLQEESMQETPMNEQNKIQDLHMRTTMTFKIKLEQCQKIITELNEKINELEKINKIQEKELIKNKALSLDRQARLRQQTDITEIENLKIQHSQLSTNYELLVREYEALKKAKILEEVSNLYLKEDMNNLKAQLKNMEETIVCKNREISHLKFEKIFDPFFYCGVIATYLVIGTITLFYFRS